MLMKDNPLHIDVVDDDTGAITVALNGDEDTGGVAELNAEYNIDDPNVSLSVNGEQLVALLRYDKASRRLSLEVYGDAKSDDPTQVIPIEVRPDPGAGA